MTNTEQYLFYTLQGGLGLPDRDYYTREDEESVSLRADYVAHVARMLEPDGLRARMTAAANAVAERSWSVETRLADGVARLPLRCAIRPTSTTSSAIALTPPTRQRRHFSWSDYFDEPRASVTCRGGSRSRPTGHFSQELNAAFSRMTYRSRRVKALPALACHQHRTPPYLADTFRRRGLRVLRHSGFAVPKSCGRTLEARRPTDERQPR